MWGEWEIGDLVELFISYQWGRYEEREGRTPVDDRLLLFERLLCFVRVEFREMKVSPN